MLSKQNSMTEKYINQTISKPVFIAGIGPRTGTTLIQRIVNSHPEAWIWGEVGGFGLAEGMWASAWSSTNKFRNDFYNRDAELYERLKGGDHLVNEWVGGLVPSHDVMRAAYRAFFVKALKTSRIWGFKAISCFHLNLMRDIFPESKIIVIFRSPIEQYKSYRMGINGQEDKEQTIATLQRHYKGYDDNKSDGDLLLNLDEYDPDTFAWKIFAFIDEEIPPEALSTAKTRVRGPVSLPLETIEPRILDLLNKEVIPYYNKILEEK